MRSYQVAPEFAREIKSALAESLSSTNGRVTLPAEALLLVNAPESVQTGKEP